MEKSFFSKTVVLQLTEDLALSIKAPQLVGIICGVIVFSITIAVVVYLLFRSGSMARFMEEMQQSDRNATVPGSATGSSASKAQARAGTHPPQYDTRPELYEHLLEATKTLPLQPSPPSLPGRSIEVRPLQLAVDMPHLLAASDGSPIFHESAYDPVARVWGWLHLSAPSVNQQPRLVLEAGGSGAAGEGRGQPEGADVGAGAGGTHSAGSDDDWPYSSAQSFQRCFAVPPGDGCHLVICDTTVGKAVGMVSLVDNQPANLSVRIDNLWLTPAFQGDSRRIAHEAMLLLLQWLVDAGYRRITVEVDVRHAIMRKFLERCGFQSEAVLRKHRIVQRRNRDSALYVVLNSEFVDVSLRLKLLLGIDPKPKVAKPAEIQEAAKGPGTPKP